MIPRSNIPRCMAPKLSFTHSSPPDLARLERRNILLLPLCSRKEHEHKQNNLCSRSHQHLPATSPHREENKKTISFLREPSIRSHRDALIRIESNSPSQPTWYSINSNSIAPSSQQICLSALVSISQFDAPHYDANRRWLAVQNQQNNSNDQPKEKFSTQLAGRGAQAVWR